MSSKQAGTLFLAGAGAIGVFLCYRIAGPFLSQFFVAAVLAIVFFPLHARIDSRLRRPNLATAFSTLFVIFTMAVPALVLGVVATRELSAIYLSLSTRSAAAGGLAPYVVQLLEVPRRAMSRFFDVSAVRLRSVALGWADQASRYLPRLGAKAAGNIFDFALGTSVVFFTLFFLFRDGRQICRRLAEALPLPEKTSTDLMTRVYDVILASAHGVIAVALAHGILIELGFWILGISAPVLWGGAAALASLIPVVGTALVWIPATIALLLAGHWIKAIILLSWESVSVVMIDTVLRPHVVGGRAKMPNLLLFFALLGGVKEFGMTGIFIGPVVVAVTMAVLELLREHTDSGQREMHSLSTDTAVQQPAGSFFLTDVENTVQKAATVI
jgi:predicted PurR-regulated permease PerM